MIILFNKEKKINNNVILLISFFILSLIGINYMELLK
jgi:hypothetical protein